MVIASKAEVGGIPFLNKKVVKEQLVKIVKIKTEPVYVTTTYEGKESQKLECVCRTQVDEPREVKWQMNATTQNFLIDKFGPDTEKWIDKEVEIAIKQAGSASAGIYPAECSLEKVIA